MDTDGGIQGDNKITCDVDYTTSAPIRTQCERAGKSECGNFSHSDVVECPPGVIEPLMENDVSSSAPGNGVMGMTGSMRTSVGIRYGLRGKKGESQDLKRERETHGR